MLVLSRQLDESIMIGDDIVITLVDIRGDKIRLGIAAPPNVAIHRQEIYEAIQRENMQAAFVDEKSASGESNNSKPVPIKLRSGRVNSSR